MLLVRDPEGTFVVDLPPGEGVRLGRAHDADVLVRAPRVSRHHAEVVPDGLGGHLLRDLGSTNGTLLDGEPLVGDTPAEGALAGAPLEPEAAGKATALPARAEIQIGACRIVYRRLA